MGCRAFPGRLAPMSRTFTVSFLPVMYVMQSWVPRAQAVERGSGSEIDLDRLLICVYGHKI